MAGNHVDAIGSYQTVNGDGGTFVQATFSEQGASPTFTLAGEINPQATDPLFKEGLLSDDLRELFEQDSVPLADHSISSEPIHPMTDTAEFHLDFGLEAANSSFDINSSDSNHSWSIGSSQSTNNLGGFIPSNDNHESLFGLNQNQQFSDLIAMSSGLEQAITISTTDISTL